MRSQWWVSNTNLQLYTDSAGGKNGGFGIYFQGEWSCGRWPDKWINAGFTRNITLLEYFPIMVAVEIWGEQLRNKKVLFPTDNQAVVQIINTLSSKSIHVMAMV